MFIAVWTHLCATFPRCLCPRLIGWGCGHVLIPHPFSNSEKGAVFWGRRVGVVCCGLKLQFSSGITHTKKTW